MSSVLRKFTIGVSRPNSWWLTLLILIVVLAPSICLVWFMNEAVQNERLAARQKLAEAYRAQLSLAQELLNNQWRRTSDDLEAQEESLSVQALFAKQVRAGLADAVVCFSQSGSVVYPLAATPQPQPDAPNAAWAEAERLQLNDMAGAAKAFGQLADEATNADLAARALQAQARCLVLSGLTNKAISLVLDRLEDERYAQAADAQGRLVVPNAELMALELMKGQATERLAAPLRRLKSRLQDYDGPAMPAAQRRFLMREMQKLAPEPALASLLAAEDLAMSYVESAQTAPTVPALRATALPGVWQFSSSHGRVVTLHRTENLPARMRVGASSQTLPADVSLSFIAPGKEAEGAFVSSEAGALFPGWRLALALNDQRLFVTAADRRIAAYVWIGVLVLAAVAILAALAVGLVRRQMALTRLRNDLVANVTHELKTPLSSMRLLVETLLDSEAPDPRTVREYLELIAQENLRLSRLIDNFLTFSRIERNKYAFKFKELPAGSIVEEAAAAIRDRFNVPGCRFQSHIAPNLPPIVADQDAMVTVLINLLDNAYKYTGDEKQISMDAAAENGGVRFRVQDNGIGLSSREIKRIFKRFYQVDQTRTHSGGGCGLGLSIVKSIVTAHHGEIEVESELGKGSTFTVLIPVAGSNTRKE